MKQYVKFYKSGVGKGTCVVYDKDKTITIGTYDDFSLETITNLVKGTIKSISVKSSDFKKVIYEVEVK